MPALQTLDPSSLDASDFRRIAFAGDYAGNPSKSNTFAWMGTSRIAAQYQDTPNNRIKGNAGWMNWAAGELRAQNKPMINMGNVAVSGSRADQFNIAGALALGAGNVVIDGPINSIAQAVAGYTPTTGPNAGVAITITTVAAACLAEYKAFFRAINAAGMRVFYVTERGAANYVTSQITALNDFNRMIADFIEGGDASGPAPNVVVLDQIPATVVSSNASAIALKNSVDGTHDNVVAARLLGTYLAAKIAPYLREMPWHRSRTLTQRSTLSAREMNQNPGLGGSTAVNTNGNTGNLPNNFTLSGAGGAVTAVFTIQPTTADADGNTWGNELKVDFTATGAGELGLVFALERGKITGAPNGGVGALVRGFWEMDVAAGAVNLQGISANLEWFPTTGGTQPVIDMNPSTVGLDTGGYSGRVLSPDPLLITAYTGSPFINSQVRAKFAGAGSATMIIRKPEFPISY